MGSEKQLLKMRGLSAETLVFAGAGLLTVLLLGPLALAVPLPIQLGLLTLAVVVLGLPHGALDPWIARQAGLYRGVMGLAGFNIAYLGLAGLVVLGWWLSPVLALTLFLLLSGWHFAGDWQPRLQPWQRVVAASALLSMPASFQPESVEAIFIALSGPDALLVAQGLRMVGYVAAAALLLVMVFAGFQGRHAELIELTVLLMLAVSVPPLIYFTVYFCLLHSPRHLRTTLGRAAPHERTRLLTAASFYTVASVALALLIAAFLMPRGDLSQLALQLVFIGLAALTVPHMLLMLLAGSRRQSLESIQ